MTVAELRQENIAFQSNLYESNNSTRRWLHNIRREWVISVLTEVAPVQAVFLEIGIGCGIYTSLMAARGKVFAVDINPSFVAAANTLPNVVAQVADVTQDRFSPVHDVALCSEVIEHVPDSVSALKNIFASFRSKE